MASSSQPVFVADLFLAEAVTEKLGQLIDRRLGVFTFGLEPQFCPFARAQHNKGGHTTCAGLIVAAPNGYTGFESGGGLSQRRRRPEMQPKPILYLDRCLRDVHALTPGRVRKKTVSLGSEVIFDRNDLLSEQLA